MLNTIRAFGLLTLTLFVAQAHSLPVSGRGTWESTLHARDADGRAVALDSAAATFFYDSTLNITWFADMLPAFGPDKPASWVESVQWAEDFAVSGYDDWRLPKALPVNGINYQTGSSNDGSTDFGYARTFDGDPATQDAWGTASELGHLFYVTLGNLGLRDPDSPPGTSIDQDGWGLRNTAYFRSLENLWYWSGSELNEDDAIIFYFYDGGQESIEKSATYPVIALVRDGDVLRVPAPSTSALLAAALLGAVVAAGTRRRVSRTGHAIESCRLGKRAR